MSTFYEKYGGLPQASTEVIPESVKPSRAPKPMQVDMQNVEVISSSGVRGLGGSAQISIPLNPQAGIMAERTCYLKLVCEHGNNGNTTHFKGSCAQTRPTFGLVNRNVIAGGGAVGQVDDGTVFNRSVPTGTAYSLINRLQVMYNNAQVMNLTNFDKLMDGILSHGANSSFMSTDANILLGAGERVVNGSRTYLLPLPGLFSAPRSIPLWAGSGALQFQIDYNTNASAFYTIGGNNAVTCNITASICYTKIDPPADFVMQGKAQLASGVYTLPYVDYQVIRLDQAQAGQQNYIHPVNSSSLRSVHFTNHSTIRLNSVVDGENSVSLRNADAGAPATANGITNIQLYCDGKPVNGYTLSSSTDAGASAQVFAELQKVFGRLYDSQRADNCDSVPQALGAGGAVVYAPSSSYELNRFMVGISTTKFLDGGFDLTGTPCGNCMIQYTTSSTQGAGAPASVGLTQFVVYTMDKILAIDGVGSSQVLN